MTEITLLTGKKVALREGLTGAHQMAASRILSGMSDGASGSINAGDMMLLGQIMTCQKIAGVDGNLVALPQTEANVIEIAAMFTGDEWAEVTKAAQGDSKVDPKNSQVKDGSGVE